MGGATAAAGAPEASAGAVQFANVALRETSHWLSAGTGIPAEHAELTVATCTMPTLRDCLTTTHLVEGAPTGLSAKTGLSGLRSTTTPPLRH